MRYAREWTYYCSLTFDVVGTAEAEIRISTDSNDGNWSAYGNGSLEVGKDKATMNIADLSKETVLHEFGHALGCIHEHQQPNNKIRWKKQVVYDYYSNAYNWNKECVDDNILNVFDKGSTNFTKYDEKSIMIYAFTPDFTEDGYSVPVNKDLSDQDKKFIREQYPY